MHTAVSKRCMRMLVSPICIPLRAARALIFNACASSAAGAACGASSLTRAAHGPHAALPHTSMGASCAHQAASAESAFAPVCKRVCAECRCDDRMQQSSGRTSAPPPWLCDRRWRGFDSAAAAQHSIHSLFACPITRAATWRCIHNERGAQQLSVRSTVQVFLAHALAAVHTACPHTSELPPAVVAAVCLQ
jgi:hypothetical protein